MNLLVCISHVPDTTAKINFDAAGTALDANGVQFVINPYDEFSLTKALHLKEAHGGTITVLNVGGPETEPTLRKALAIGADNAIRINANPKDGFFVAKQLANVLKDGNYNLVIAGKESLDYNGGMVPGMLAGFTDYNFVNSCISLDIDGDNAKAVRE